MEISPAVIKPPGEVESFLLQCLIPTVESTSCLCWHFHLKDLTTQSLVALVIPFPPAEKCPAWWWWWCTSWAGRARSCCWNTILPQCWVGTAQSSVRGSKVSHTLTQKSCSLPTRWLELLTFLTKSLFLLLSALQSHGTLVGWAGFFCVLHIINKIVS